MAWSQRRRRELPPDWSTLRRRVLRRDGWRCTWIVDGSRCPAWATDVDHIGDRHDHRLLNLRALCQYHHSRRTIAQSVAARQAKATARAIVGLPPTPRRARTTTNRIPESHPGLT